ncbi:Sensor histidine kinase RcsC [Neomoorella glycerini]|uniref:Stage 0 sporulation protein A homolog n=1 Tax=Neomoorella glycerini TaxID=55779 RepID=A0A6I5ZWL2_9FIRM|nr:HD domain-containing phosphohydrolase [Moorella glycerini]QGP93978.1 Sensor histidine kinase RcsC [Moorella glycerini]
MEKRPKILVVDDEEMNLVLMEAMLAPLGYEVLTAKDGEGALAKVARENPDLILLDVMMPRLDGFTICRMLKDDETTRFIPVIMVTALDQLEDRVRGLNAGADDFLSKPFNELELTTRVRSLLRVKHLNDQLRYAHQHINYITRHVEGLLGSFDPLQFKLETARKELLQQLLGLKERAPEAVLVATVSGPESWEGWLYRRQGGTIHSEAVAFALPEDSPAGELLLRAGREGVFGNREDEKGEAVFTFVKTSLPAGPGPWYNYAGYYHHPFLVVAFNYPAGVTAYELDVLRNLLTYSQFLQLVGGQIREKEEAFHYTIKALARAAEANDEDTGNHITRVGIFARELARDLGCAENFCREIALAAQMHDVGKVHIHPDILRKPDRLTPAEWRIMQQHTIYGARILGDALHLKMAREVALHHHEKWDGSGYPAGLKGEEISLAGRIVALADIYDALRNKRSYKPAFSHEEACQIIIIGDGRVRPEHFDPAVLATFQRVASHLEEIYEILKD